MAAPVRLEISELGPRNGSVWSKGIFGGSISPDGASGVIPIWVVPPITVNTVQGQAIQDRLPSDNDMENISQVIVTALTDQTAGAFTTLTFSVYRAGVIVGGGPFAGWTAASSPALTGLKPDVVPFIVANTALVALDPLSVPVSATQALMPLQPLDVVTVDFSSDVSSLFVTLDGH